ncbi:MAG: hypothetical protein AB8B80_16600 [Marinicellaceae bacterium]
MNKLTLIIAFFFTILNTTNSSADIGSDGTELKIINCHFIGSDGTESEIGSDGTEDSDENNIPLIFIGSDGTELKIGGKSKTNCQVINVDPNQTSSYQ